MPPLTRFLSPFKGVWVVQRDPDPRRPIRPMRVEGLQQPARVWVEKSGIRHIYAENAHDLYFAQGFLTAYDRLFQMDFVSRVASGRLAQILGERALTFDKFFRRLELSEAAEASLLEMQKDPSSWAAIQAYTQGVNAYIQELDPPDDPIEMKLLNYRPTPRTEKDVALLIKFMAFQLSFRNQELSLSRVRERLSAEEFSDLFPFPKAIVEPIIPSGTKWEFGPVSVPERPQRPWPSVAALPDFLLSGNIQNGSNNWAVGAGRSKSGFPMLSNDIHLDYALPNLFYEMQLQTPEGSVYGATIPGAPGIVLGFNQDLAWAVTNGGSDVVDWYKIRYANEEKTKYFAEQGVADIQVNRQVIHVKGRKDEILESRRTDLGPIIFDEGETSAMSFVPSGMAVHWQAHQPSNEIKTFLGLNLAKSVAECEAALVGYSSPAQNFICVDRQHIGIFHAGRFPLRWREQGRFVGEAEGKDFRWAGEVPAANIPKVVDPPRGFVSSANQDPTDETYPYYLGDFYDVPFRALRINQLLRGEETVTPDYLVRMQGDDYSVFAERMCKRLLALLPSKISDPGAAASADALSIWDFRYDERSVGASIFDRWWRVLEPALWRTSLGDDQWPSTWRTLQLLESTSPSKWTQNISDLALQTLIQATADLREKWGTDMHSWRWSRVRETEFAHLSKIPGLGRKVDAAGTAYSIFANTGKHGPVWKLVVGMTSGQPRAWAIHPGGVSGHPTSRYYDNFMTAWSRNEMRPVQFMDLKQGKPQEVMEEWILRN